MKENLSVPIAIVVAGIIIGGALYFSNMGGSNTSDNPNPTPTPTGTEMAELGPGPITEQDHVLGNPNAPVSMFIYSDLECPYCRNFHETTNQVSNDYGKNGQVKIIFRHFPLSQIHPSAQKLAEGSECAAELGGEEKFWGFIDKLIELGTTDPLKTAQSIGIDKTAFQSCLDSGKYAQKISSDLQDGIESGVQGTPNAIIVSNSGKKYYIPGAFPYLDSALYSQLDPVQRTDICSEETQECGVKITIEKALAE
ncbi:MAG: thioredoxin domain-containing protein, partial [Patescibacteria group bacterium]